MRGTFALMCALVIGYGTALQVSAQPAPGLPNVVLIVTDDVGVESGRHFHGSDGHDPLSHEDGRAGRHEARGD